jgi:hypothetical protein
MIEQQNKEIVYLNDIGLPKSGNPAYMTTSYDVNCVARGA